MRTVILLGMLLAFPAVAEAQVAPMTSAQRPDTAARAALQTFARLVSQRNFRAFGFETAEDVRVATLGQPLREYMVWLEELRSYTPSANAESLLHAVDRVAYPVLVRGAVRSSLTLALERGRWTSYAFGNPTLTRSIEELRTELVARERLQPAEIVLLRVPALNTAFLAWSVNQRTVLTPLADDARFGFQRGALMPAADAFGRMVAAARAHNGLPT